jgi:hypothetical protein
METTSTTSISGYQVLPSYGGERRGYVVGAH